MNVTFDQDVYHRIVYMFNGAFYKVELLHCIVIF